MPTLAANLWVDIMSQALVIPAIQKIETFFNSGKPKSNAVTAARDRCLVRGALLEMLVYWLDDDGIFASSAIREILSAPSRILGEGKKDEMIVKQIFDKHTANPFDVLHPVLDETFNGPEIQDIATSLSTLVQNGTEQLANGRLSKKGPHFQVHQRKKLPLPVFTTDPALKVEPTEILAELLPLKTGLRADKLACILREALLFKRSPEIVGDPSLARILRCLHPTMATRSFITKDPDHVNPIRCSNKFQSLMESSLGVPVQNIASRYGLSNILVRIGTGQGWGTERFVRQLLTPCWFTSVSQCVDKFEQGLALDLVVENQRIWGQPISQLGFSFVDRTDDKGNTFRTFDFEARFNLFFDTQIQRQWYCFVTGVELSSLPDDFTVPDTFDIPDNYLPSYNAAWQLGADLKIPGFGNGLTRMQLANTLSLLNRCHSPSPDEMVDIIMRNKEKGAFQGLQRLGFNITPSSDRETVRKAFFCVYYFLDNSLSQADKETLGFGAIFVEHLLCKVKRWDDAFDSKSRDQLDSIAAKYQNSAVDSDEFPVPLSIDRASLQSWLASPTA